VKNKTYKVTSNWDPNGCLEALYGEEVYKGLSEWEAKMKTQHTPEPWYVAETGNHQRIIIEEQTGKTIAVAYDKTDAALLAAAPELLEALVDLLEVANSRGRRLGIDEGGPVLDKTREAIAKATQK
jgi:hypothetical protein